MSNDKLETLESIDHLLRGTSVAKTTAGARRGLSTRARVHADLGLPEAALEDSLRAYFGTAGATLTDLLNTTLKGFKHTPPSFDPVAKPVSGAETSSGTAAPVAEVSAYVLSARLAEALRVYVRDVLLSKQPGGEPNTLDTIECSVFFFNRAELELKQAHTDIADDDQELTWIRAHRGAARSLHYWLLLTSGSASAGKVFADADRDFLATKRRAGARYVWSIRFRAFLYALRAAPGDFALASTLVESVMDADPRMQSSLNRSLAMLYSYQAATPGLADEIRRDAARAGVTAGAAAVEQDAEDYFASYFTAANWWWLSMCESDPDKRATHDKAQRAAIVTARTRAMNAMSLALASLAGLRLMEALPPCPMADLQDKDRLDKRAIEDVVALMQSFQLVFPPDFETRLVFARDPVWSAIKHHMPKVYEQFQSSLNYDKLYAHFSAL